MAKQYTCVKNGMHDKVHYKPNIGYTLEEKLGELLVGKGILRAGAAPTEAEIEMEMLKAEQRAAATAAADAAKRLKALEDDVKARQEAALAQEKQKAKS